MDLAEQMGEKSHVWDILHGVSRSKTKPSSEDLESRSAPGWSESDQSEPAARLWYSPAGLKKVAVRGLFFI